MNYDAETALALVKSRLNRLPGDTSIDDYLTVRIDGAALELQRQGVTLTDAMNDTLLLVDTTVWQYQSRDKTGAMPDWLRLRLRERWLMNDSG